MSTNVSQVNAKSSETKWTVPAGDTSAVRGDGRGVRHYTTTPKTPGHNVTTNAARHATGQSLARVGNIRGGQSEPAGNWPVTGVPKDAPIRSMAPRPTVELWSNQAETSKTAEAAISGPPTPFRAEGGAATLLPGSVKFAEVGIGYEYISTPDAPLSKRGYGVAPQSKSEMEAAASVDGMPSSAGQNPIITGFPLGAPRQAGRPGSRNSSTSPRENSRMRQS
jgi:hypothetical protein